MSVLDCNVIGEKLSEIYDFEQTNIYISNDETHNGFIKRYKSKPTLDVKLGEWGIKCITGIQIWGGRSKVLIMMDFKKFKKVSKMGRRENSRYIKSQAYSNATQFVNFKAAYEALSNIEDYEQTSIYLSNDISHDGFGKR